MTPITAWAIKAPDGYIFPDYVEKTRSKLIRKWDYDNWKLWYRRGYRCVRVTVQEMQE